MDSIDKFFTSRSSRKTPKKAPKIIPATGDIKRHSGGSPWRHTKTGYREDLEIVLRSGWEANVARVLKAYNIVYEFEPIAFSYPLKRGTRSYTPDFRLTKTEEWIEVKGYFDDKSRIKLKRFKLYYPEEFEKLTLIIGGAKKAITICESLEVPFLFYSDIAKRYKGIISNWE